MQPSVGSRPPKKRQIVRLKTGCLTCKRRKLKCGEEKPQCQRCRVSNRQCTGLNYGSEARATTVAITIDTYGDSSIRLNDGIGAPILHRSPKLLGYHSTSSTVSNLLKAFPTFLCTSLWEENNIANGQKGIIRRFIGYLPSRSGRFAHLDAATLCLTTRVELFVTEASQQQELQRFKMINSYQVALRRLKRALKDPMESLLPETLLTASLLCCYEAFDGPGNDALAQHISGLGKIFEHYGAARIRTELEFELLEAHMPSITYMNFKAHMPCIFARKEWILQLRNIASQQRRGRRKMLLDLNISCISAFQLIFDCTALIISKEYYTKHQSPHYKSIYKQVHEDSSQFFQLHKGLIETATIQGYQNEAWYRQYIGGANAIQILYSRLLVAVDADGADMIERNVQQYAINMNGNGIHLDANYSRTEMELLATDAALSTAEEWLEFTSTPNIHATGSTKRLIAPEIYIRWLRLLGVKSLEL